MVTGFESQRLVGLQNANGESKTLKTSQRALQIRSEIIQEGRYFVNIVGLFHSSEPPFFKFLSSEIENTFEGKLSTAWFGLLPELVKGWSGRMWVEAWDGISLVCVFGLVTLTSLLRSPQHWRGKAETVCPQIPSPDLLVRATCIRFGRL